LDITVEIVSVMAVIVTTVVLFIIGGDPKGKLRWLKVDVVAIIVMVSLPLLGLIDPNQAFVGFSSNAVISIIGVIIIGAGLDKTGIMNKVAKPITRAAKNSESRLVVLISSTVAVISSFMQNIGAVALFLPATQRICKEMCIPPSRVLIPMGYLGIIGGCLTLVGSSPLILLNDLMGDLEPFQLFDVTPIGVSLIVAGVAYFVVFGKLVLPSRAVVAPGARTLDFKKEYHTPFGLFELTIAPDCKGILTLEDMSIRRKYLCTVVGISKHVSKIKWFAPTRNMRLDPQDAIAVVGSASNVKLLAEAEGMIVKKELDLFSDSLSPMHAGMVEAIIPPRSAVEGFSFRELHFREKYEVNPIAIRRGEKIFFGGLSDIPIQQGDVLLLQGIYEKFTILKKTGKLSFITEFEEEEAEEESKAKFALSAFAITLLLIITGYVELSVALMAGATGMVLTQVLSIEEAYQAVDWRTVFLLAGLIPLGIATQTSGTAEFIAIWLLDLVGNISPILLLTLIGMLTSVFTLVVSNVGATVLLVPLAISMAASTGVDPRMAALVVAVSASNTFILPTHQVNAYIMGPGDYKTTDYLKAGSIMTVLYLVVMLSTIYLFYGI